MAGYGFRCDKCAHEVVEDTTVNYWPCPKCGKGSMSRDINVKGGRLDAYAWPGGYPLIYVTKDCEVLCARCAAEDRDNDSETGLAYDTHMEGPSEFCGGCGKEIESAYGDPDSEEGDD